MVYENSLSLSLSPVQSVSGAALIHDHEKAMEGGGNIYLVCESASVFLPFVVVRAMRYLNVLLAILSDFCADEVSFIGGGRNGTYACVAGVSRHTRKRQRKEEGNIWMGWHNSESDVRPSVRKYSLARQVLA